MDSFELYISGEPVAQGRPRFSNIHGYTQAIDPAKSREFKQLLAGLAREQMAHKPLMEGPLCLYLIVNRVPPKSWPKYKVKQALVLNAGITSKPDLDNYVKIVLDALNGVVFRDDSCVVKICAAKRWAEHPGMTIKVREDR